MGLLKCHITGMYRLNKKKGCRGRGCGHLKNNPLESRSDNFLQSPMRCIRLFIEHSFMFSLPPHRCCYRTPEHSQGLSVFVVPAPPHFTSFCSAFSTQSPVTAVLHRQCSLSFSVIVISFALHLHRLGC